MFNTTVSRIFNAKLKLKWGWEWSFEKGNSEVGGALERGQSEGAEELSSFAQAMQIFFAARFFDVVGVLLLACHRVLQQSLRLAR